MLGTYGKRNNGTLDFTKKFVITYLGTYFEYLKDSMKSLKLATKFIIGLLDQNQISSFLFQTIKIKMNINCNIRPLNSLQAFEKVRYHYNFITYHR